MHGPFQVFNAQKNQKTGNMVKGVKNMEQISIFLRCVKRKECTNIWNLEIFKPRRSFVRISFLGKEQPSAKKSIANLGAGSVNMI